MRNLYGRSTDVVTYPAYFGKSSFKVAGVDFVAEA